MEITIPVICIDTVICSLFCDAIRFWQKQQRNISQSVEMTMTICHHLHSGWRECSIGNTSKALQDTLESRQSTKHSKPNVFTLAFRESTRGRRLCARDAAGTIDAYNLPAGSPVSVSHIFVLLMYCNDTELQYR